LLGGVGIEDVLELSDRRWDLQSEVEDLLLALETDILGPLHHTREVSSRLDVLTDAIVAATLLDKRVLDLLAYTIEFGRVPNIPLAPSLIPHQP
jgi:hypothetical protein